MFDTHVHLDASPLFESLEEELQKASDEGVRYMAVPAVDLDSIDRCLKIPPSRVKVLPCLGVHPLYLAKYHKPPLEEFDEFMKGARFWAVGEVGLDFWEGRADEEKQREFLASFAGYAKAKRLPLLVHQRKAFYDTMKEIELAGFDGPGIVHAFAGSYHMAANALDRGFMVSASAILLRPDKKAVAEVFKKLPLTSIVVETDAPDLPPWPRKHGDHKPWELCGVVAALADILGRRFEEVAEITEDNAKRLFGAD